MAKVITTELQHAGASAANITLDSSKNVTAENNLTVDGNLAVTGTTALTGAVTLPDNTITNAKVADDAIGVAELSASGTASSSTFLRGDNAWAAAGGGKLLQVQQVTYNTETSTNGNTWVDVHSTNFKVDITPTSTDSHFIIHVHMNGITIIGDDVNYAQFRLKGTGSGLDTEEWFGYNIGLTQSANHEWTRGMATASYTYYETAQLNATSTVTFKVQWRGSSNDLSDNVYIGYGGSGASECSIVVMEVDD